ncbi:mavicyanin [Cucumis sativus]|uniref:Phytocyanin domain-containing protein n=1 Tax=Cucumis sativus TaxID=3659 RepID=A0A0A0K806_CUCSA|nr:mavicyanin [Cucumis sativus]KGN45598.1 hypothetical protein Csa_015707 [Cucumis sativus]
MKTTYTPPFSAYMLVISTAVMVAATAFQFKVGDEIGWQLPPTNDSEFYVYWASINRFQIGDSLSFEYKNDSVLMVEKWDYYHCNSSDPILGFNNGKGVIKLNRAGAFYFISGFSDHCRNGQRLLVRVMLPHDLIVASPPQSTADDAPSPSFTNDGAPLPVTAPVVFFPMAAIVEMLLISHPLN